MIDLHIHGAFGVDVLTADAAALDQLARGLAARGVEGFLPTLVPVPFDELALVVKRLSDWIRSRSPGDGRGAMPFGIHFEGPFVATARCGALHAELFQNGDGEGLGRFLESVEGLEGRPMITLAPEIAGGIRLVKEFVRRGFVVSIGHTDAGSATLDEARRAGARHMTHFGNAMRGFHHREVGPIGWGLLNDDVTVDLVADLQHLSPEMLRLVFKTKGASRVAVISDAIPAAGLADGRYEIWGETLEVAKGAVRNIRGALAGSVTLLDEAVSNLVALDIADARASALDVPRRILGI